MLAAAPVPDLLEAAVFALLMVPVLYFDLRERRIPDFWLLAAAAALALLRLLRGTLAVGQAVGAAAGFLVFFLLWLAARRRIGLGDAKLSALAGFLLGPWGWTVAVFAASFSGVLFVGARRLAGRGSLSDSVPFAPFLVGGALAAWLLSPALKRFFLRL